MCLASSLFQFSHKKVGDLSLSLAKKVGDLSLSLARGRVGGLILWKNLDLKRKNHHISVGDLSLSLARELDSGVLGTLVCLV